MEEGEEPGPSNGTDSMESVPTLKSTKPSKGTVWQVYPVTQVYLGTSEGFHQVCNYTFSIAGNVVLIFKY